MNEIFHRVSIRKYENRPVEREKLMKIACVRRLRCSGEVSNYG